LWNRFFKRRDHWQRLLFCFYPFFITDIPHWLINPVSHRSILKVVLELFESLNTLSWLFGIGWNVKGEFKYEHVYNNKPLKVQSNFENVLNFLAFIQILLALEILGYETWKSHWPRRKQSKVFFISLLVPLAFQTILSFNIKLWCWFYILLIQTE